MNRTDYSEAVRLLMPGLKNADMSLANAVRTVMDCADPKVRMMAVIVRDGEPIRNYVDIERIYTRPDFPPRR